MYNFDPYNVFLAIATNIPQLLKTGFVVQGQIIFSGNFFQDSVMKKPTTTNNNKNLPKFLPMVRKSLIIEFSNGSTLLNDTKCTVEFLYYTINNPKETHFMDTHLVGSTGRPLWHHGWVRNIITQIKIGTPAGKVTLVQFDRCGQNLSIGAQQRTLISTLTLDPPTEHIPKQNRAH